MIGHRSSVPGSGQAGGPDHAAGTARRIGPVGTAGRAAVGLALLAIAVADKPAGVVWGLEPYELVLGLLALPGVSVGIGLLAQRRSDAPLRFTSDAGIAANFLVIVALFANPYTAGAAALFYGVSLLVAAWRDQPDCEATVLSNLILRRDDQIGCPTFTPIDAIERRTRR